MTPCNTTIPHRKSEIFSTAADGQTSVEVHVLQGEREMARHNKTLGRFHLTDIPAAPRGLPQIEVTFDIDANGITHVSAKDLGTGKEQRITITASSGLDKNEVGRMVQDAEAHAEEDRQAREAADARNRADQMIYQVEKTLRDAASKVPEGERKDTEEAVAAAKAALERGDTGEIKSTTERLERASHRLEQTVLQKLLYWVDCVESRTFRGTKQCRCGGAMWDRPMKYYKDGAVNFGGWVCDRCHSWGTPWDTQGDQ